MIRMNYESTRIVESKTYPGVTFTVRKMSFERRMELIRSVRQSSGELEFRAASESVEDQLGVAAINATMESIYIRWGLESLEGIQIDGAAADADALLRRGPEALCHEIAAEVRRECGLTEQERKN